MHPSSIAHYQIISKLGSGAMGDVYQALDTKLGREVAIKVIHSSIAEDPASLSRFERESKILASLNHPHIATIHGFEEVEGTMAIIMELADGETLESRLKTGRLSIGEVLSLFRQIAEALNAAHEKDIVHRDLKPANIKITTEQRVKVLDFGIAKAIESKLSGVSSNDEAETLPMDVTIPGTILGSPAYMSPEQIRAQDVDARSDVWAFGACLFEALTGRRPFQAETISDLMVEVLQSDPDFSLLPSETPKDVLSVLRGCLEKEPRRRLRDMNDISIRLKEIAKSPLSPEHSDIPRKATGFTKTQKFASTIAAIAISVGLGFLISQSSFPNSSKENVPIQSIAIFPFENAGSDTEIDYIIESMSNELRKKLQSIDGLEVRTPVSVTGEESAAELGVDAVLSGSITSRDGRIEISHSVVSASDPSAKILGTLTGTQESIFTIQSDMALEFATEIGIDLSEDDKRRIRASSDVAPMAWALYQKGLLEFDKFTPESLKEARRLFIDSVREDGGYLDPRIRLAEAHWLPTIWGGGTVYPDEAFRNAQSVLNDAEAFFTDESDVRKIELARAYFEMISEFNWVTIGKALNSEIDRPLDQIDPHIYWVRCWYQLFVTGQYHDALIGIKTAISHDQDRMAFQDALAEVYAFMGNEKKALELNQKIKALYPDELDRQLNIVISQKNIAKQLRDTGKDVEAQALFDEALLNVTASIESSSNNPGAIAVHAEVLAAMGKTLEAQRLLTTLEERRKSEVFVPAVWMARVYAELGDTKSAIDLLEEARDKKEGNSFLYNLRKFDLLELLGDDQRYWYLIESMNYPPFPFGHPFHEKEQAMRFGKNSGLAE